MNKHNFFILRVQKVLEGSTARARKHLKKHVLLVNLIRATKSTASRVDRRCPLRLKGKFLLRTLPLRIRQPTIVAKEDPKLVVSLTSFPARITTVWASIETLMRQTLLPDAIVLVLSLDEFPGKRLPRSLRSLERRGLTVRWVSVNTGSFKKLLPTRLAFPQATIVTVDDDILYSRNMLALLVEEHTRHPECIVGHRGWDPIVIEQGYAPYHEWTRAKRRAGPDSDPSEVLLTGGAGALYPPNTPPDWLLLDIELARELSPLSDDVWCWGVAKATGVKRFCTGAPFGATNGLFELGPALYRQNKFRDGRITVKDRQIAAVTKDLPNLAEKRKGLPQTWLTSLM